MATASKAKKGKSKAPPTPEEIAKKIQLDHRALVRAVFRGSGFVRITGVSDKEFEYQGRKSDFDDIFMYENIVLLCEYTVRKSSNIGDHLKKKKIIYDKILADGAAFLSFLKTTFAESADQLTNKYHTSKQVVKVVYCARYEFEDNYKNNVPGPAYMDYSSLRYFFSVVEAIKKSALPELLNFLGILPKLVGRDGKINVSMAGHDYPGLLLPEAHSNFDDGYKVVSFYADPDALLRTSYVLRKDGWRDSMSLYQRMISKPKIEAIRTYLKEQRRVFINNIIVTLPDDVKPISGDGETIDTKTLVDTAPIKIKLPDAPNSVGLIDGQHRVFAYYESLADDAQIAQLRVQQNLLVTGIIYPKGTSDAEKQKFEARLFLEINSTQTSAKSPLKQAIGIVLHPYAPESIAARTLAGMARTGPLTSFIEQHFYDTERLKTASIVSYGLKPLVKTSGADSLYSIWNNPRKSELNSESDLEILEEYIKFCISSTNIFLSSVKKNLGPERWTTDRRVTNRVLATTYINAFLITLRLLIAKGQDLDRATIDVSLSELNKFDFSAYHSSQYAKMAERIVQDHFPLLPTDSA